MKVLPQAAAWPTPQDYNEAVQSPRLNFDDPDLRDGISDVTALGLPRPITGGFASVYSIRTGSKRWAVRCFLRDFSDHKQRYEEIGRQLETAKLPYTVDFRFLEKGIRVRGRWYPVLKMEWIEGSTFQEVIEANLQKPTALANLAERWLKMLSALKKHGIAHGDLQHGNVLIADGDFRLIDYDGMFVPAFAGSVSHEVGHRNYQHPARTEKDFGPHVDNFSGWAVYLTLTALSIDPSLWRRYGGGEEHLLFQKEDFDQPRFSRLMRNLQHVADDRVQKYLPLFTSYLGMRLSSIASPADVIGAPARKRTPRHVPLPGWSRENQLDLFVQPKPAAVRAPAIEPAAASEDRPAETPSVIHAGGSAIEGPVTLPDAIPLHPPVAPERALTVSYAAFMVALIALAARGVLPGLETGVVVLAGLLCTATCLGFSYIAMDEVRAKLAVWFLLELKRYRHNALRFGVGRVAKRMSAVDLKEAQEMARLTAKDGARVRRQQDRIAEVKRTLASWIDELNVRRKTLEVAEASEAARLLLRLQAQHDDFLLESAFLANIGAEGLRGRERKKFEQWRKHAEELSQAGPPKTISSEDRLRIRKKYDMERRAIHRSESFVRWRARNKILGIRQTRDRRHQRLELQRDAVHRRLEQRKDRLRQVVDRGNSWVAKQAKEIHQARSEMLKYREVRFTNYLQRIVGMSRLRR
ncbi:MAG TPA: hypothetical protein VGK48_24095 [Terriglobia bacterium]|jgi:hypothetical protein